MMNLTKTPAGQAKLRQWFLRPSLELNVINHRHDAIKCLLSQENCKKTCRTVKPSSRADKAV